MKTNIYRLVEIQSDYSAKFYDKKFYGTKKMVEDAIYAACFSLEIGGRNVEISDYTFHHWNSVNVDGDGWYTATFCKNVTINSEMFGEKYIKNFVLGYISYELES